MNARPKSQGHPHHPWDSPTMEVSTSMTDSAVCATTLRFSPHRFTGKERDTESGNDYFGARYYSSAMGRFMSPDWAGRWPGHK